MNEVILGLSALLLVYASIAVIAATIRAALKSKKQHPAAGKPPEQPVAKAGEPYEEPYYQPLCHHSHPIHPAK